MSVIFWLIFPLTFDCLACLHFLRRHDDTRYAKISEEHRGSLKWFWEHPHYLQWSSAITSSLLYIEGKPGSGKSTLAKYFQRNLADMAPNIKGTVAYYFYTYRGTEIERTHENMLRSILYSILQQEESAFFLFQRELRKFEGPSGAHLPYESLKLILSSFAQYPSKKPIYLIIDAIDESTEEDRRTIIQLICQLCSPENMCLVKVFLASRPVANVTHRIKQRYPAIIMQAQNTHDICVFADEFLNLDLQLTGEKLAEATNYITENAKGVFVWVSLIKAELLRNDAGACSSDQIVRCLKNLPKELEEFYLFMFHRLESGTYDDIRDGIRLFRFVLFALRPLALDELRDALAMPDNHSPLYMEFQRNKIGPIARRIEHCGGNFLEIKGNSPVYLVPVTTQTDHFCSRQHRSNHAPDCSRLFDTDYSSCIEVEARA